MRLKKARAPLRTIAAGIIQRNQTNILFIKPTTTDTAPPWAAFSPILATARDGISCLSMNLCIFMSATCTNSVAVPPGWTLVTVTPKPIHSVAKVSLKLRTKAFVTRAIKLPKTPGSALHTLERNQNLGAEEGGGRRGENALVSVPTYINRRRTPLNGF